MGQLKRVNLNDIIALMSVEHIEELRREFTHLYVPKDSFDLLSGNNRVFADISRSLFAQHWLAASSFRWLDELETELRNKEDDVYDAIEDGYSGMQSKQGRRVDPAFETIRQEYFNEAQIEANEHEACDGMRDMQMARLMVFSLAEETLNEIKKENAKRAFGGLFRTMTNGLKRLKANARSERAWRTEEIIPGEARYVHLLREFDANSEDLNISEFGKRLGKLYELNRLRNQAEHEADATDKDKNNYSEENLVACFKEIKALFEALEDDPVFKPNVQWIA